MLTPKPLLGISIFFCKKEEEIILNFFPSCLGWGFWTSVCLRKGFNRWRVTLHNRQTALAHTPHTDILWGISFALLNANFCMYDKFKRPVSKLRGFCEFCIPNPSSNYRWNFLWIFHVLKSNACFHFFLLLMMSHFRWNNDPHFQGDQEAFHTK